MKGSDFLAISKIKDGFPVTKSSEPTRWLWSAFVFFLLASCATTFKPQTDQPQTLAALPSLAEKKDLRMEAALDHPPAVKEEPLSLEEKWGVRVLSIRESAGGYMLDFRYRVIDPDKASQLVSRKDKPYLIDQATGARFMVPSPPKIGPLRQTAVKPLANRNYFILFVNPGKYVKPGNKVTVVIGDFRAEDLVVE